MNRKLFLHNIGKGINILILFSLILINSIPIGTQPVFAQSSNPSFSVRLAENQVHGYDWPLGASVTLTIDGTVVGTKTVVAADWDPNQTFVWFDAALQPDQVIEMSDGVTTKSHTVTNLIVTGVDPVNDTVSGKADPGTQVDIGHIFCDENGCYGFRRETADSNGDWLADFSVPGEDDDEQDIIDIQPGMGSEARQCDGDGDCTQYGWYVPNPAFGVRANEDRIEGWEWTLGSILTIEIDDPTSSNDPDPIYATVVVADWDPNQTWFNVNLENYDLKTGDIVTVTDGDVIKTHTVTSLAFTDVNLDEDIVTGVATSESHVDIWACPNNGDCINRHVDADTGGIWVADFGQFGDENDEQNTFNIVAGTWIDSSQSDEDGDQTYWGENVPDPRIEVSYEHDWIQIRDFTPGGEVTYTIYDYEGGHALFGPVTGPVDSHGDGWIDYGLHHTDLIPGNYVTAVNESTDEEVSILIRDLNLDYIGVDEDLAFGTAEPNTTIEFHISETHDDWFSLSVNVDGAGNWFADLAAEGHPIDSYRHAGINLYDAEGDNIYAQPPRIHAEIRSDHFNVDNFSKNADVTLTLYDSPGGNVLYGPVTLRTDSSGNAWVNLWPYGIDLVPGNYIVAYDHHLDFTKSLEIEPFTFDGMNTIEDYVYGTSAVGEWVDLHVTSLFSNWGLEALTDENGHWTRDYGNEDYDITDQMWANGWATDDADNWSEDHTTGLPNIEASIADDWISGFNFSPDRQVRISFFDSDGGSLIKTFLVTAWGDTQFFANYWDHGVDLQAGMYLLVEDLETGKYSELTLVPLTFDGVDYDADTAWGHADPGTQVVVRANKLFESHEITVIADVAGNWFANFSSEGADLTAEWDLRALVFDLEFDATVADAPRPPELTASVDGDWISGENWMPDQSVSIYVYDSDGGSPVGTTITWNTDNYGSFYAELGKEGIDLLPGYHIVVEDNYSGVIKTITLPNLTIDYIDPINDVAGGHAPADTRLSVDFSNQQESIQFDLFSESDGTWEADFAAHDFDLQPGSQGNVRLTDEDGDSTQVDGYVPNPTFSVRVNYDGIEGWEWPLGATVTIEIDDWTTTEDPDPLTVTVGIADWDPNQTYFGLNIENYDLKTGDTVIVTDGNTTKELIITPFEITGYDLDTEMVYGEAGENQHVNVWTCWQNDPCIGRDEIADGIGYWETDFSVPGEQDWEQETADLRVGSWIDSSVTDADGDQIMFGFNTAMTNQPPEILSITAPIVPVQLGQSIDATITFSDPDVGDTHTIIWSWGDDSITEESATIPSVTDAHTYTDAGIYTISATIIDSAGESASATFQYVVIYDPGSGFVTGGGWIDSPLGAYYPSNLPYFDGSYYEIVVLENPLTFAEAREAVEAMTYGTCESAHLATITSQEEYETALTLFDDWHQAELGGYQNADELIADEGWQWVTGEPFDFEVQSDWWLPGEPNDCGDDSCTPGSEQILEMYPDGWNDVQLYDALSMYYPMVEYEGCDQGPTGKANFGFVSKYKKGASFPTGNTEFQFKAGDLNFHSTSYDWLVVTGSDYARFKGTGTINGEGEYKFMIWAGDENGSNGEDTFRIKIWYEDGGSEVVVYDNGMDQEIGGGSIVVHTK